MGGMHSIYFLRGLNMKQRLGRSYFIDKRIHFVKEEEQYINPITTLHLPDVFNA